MFHSHKISKSDSSGGEPVICDSAQLTTWVAWPPLHQPPTTHQHDVHRKPTTQYRNQAQKLEEKQSSNEIGAHDNGRVGWDHQIHTSRLPRLTRNYINGTLAYIRCHTRLSSAMSALPDNQSPSNRWHFT